MIKCNNPLMKEHGKPSKCAKGKIGCCRHCKDAQQCLSTIKENDCLCPYITKQEDLNYECPFELV